MAVSPDGTRVFVTGYGMGATTGSDYATSVHAVQGCPEPRALRGRQQVHLHFHGVTAEEVAAIVASVSRDR